LRLKGQPSRIHPFKRQSGLLNLSLTKSITTSSGTISEQEVGFTIIIALTDSVLGNVALELARVVVVVIAPGHLFDKLGDLDVDNLVLLCNANGILLFFGTRRAHQDDSLRTSGSVGVLELQNAVDFFDNSHLGLIALQLCDEALADVLDSLQLTRVKGGTFRSVGHQNGGANLQVILKDSVSSESVAVFRVVNRAEPWLCLLTAQVSADCRVGLAILLVE